jgi:recombination protein RecA
MMALKLNAPPLATEATSPPDKKSTSTNLLEVLAAIRKEKGPKVIVSGDQIAVVRRLPTGIFEFDFYTGGGFPCGRYTIIYGPESSCKTNICLKAVASAQKLPGPCNKAIWVNIEQSFDPVWAAVMGVDVSKLLVVEAGYGEEAVDLTDALVRADDVAIVVVDSIAGLVASKEIAQSVEKYDIGTSALLIKRMVNKMMVAFCDERKKGHDPCVILINQTRFKPGVAFGDPETMPGGEAQKFLSSLRVRLYAKNVIDKPTSTLVFKDVHAVIKKAKVPVRAVDFDFQFCVHAHDDLKIGETDSWNMVKSHLQALGHLFKSKHGYSLTTAPQEYPTLVAMQERYLKDDKFRMQIQALVIASYKDKLVLVDEPVYEPKDVKPGQPVQSSANNG